jgi:tetratricopeptide (TPR) repeat protein
MSLVPLALALVSAAPGSDPYMLVRQGNAAFEREAYTEALALYEQAEALITDPGLVAFNKAAALYRLERFRDAELHYRYCLGDAAGERQARVLYDLANSLVQQDAGKNADKLREAIRRYQECLRHADADEALRSAARRNLELARLRLLQAPLPPKRDGESGEEPPQPEPSSNGSQDPPKDGDLKTPSTGQPDPQKGKPEQVTPAPGEEPIRVDQPQPAGKGTLPPVPDEDQLVPMAPEDTRLHLQRARERILRERHSYQQSTAAKAGKSARPW